MRLEAMAVVLNALHPCHLEKLCLPLPLLLVVHLVELLPCLVAFFLVFDEFLVFLLQVLNIVAESLVL